jgi:hypothetical protein
VSDCFDHEADAWDDLMCGRSADGQDERPLYSSYPGCENSTNFHKPKKVTCQYCGKKKLRWVNTSAGWRLMSKKKKKLHICKEYLSKKAH